MIYPPPPPQLTALFAMLAVLLGVAGTAVATSTCTAPYNHRGQTNQQADRTESQFRIAGIARYIVNPTYPHTPCARLCHYVTPVSGQVCPQRTWFKWSDSVPRPSYCSSNPACQGPKSDQEVTNEGCDPTEDAREAGLVASIPENSEFITMNLQHWERDMRLVGTHYACEVGELGLR